MADVSVEVRVTDSEPFEAFVNGVACAAGSFAKLTDGERAALPAAAQEGIGALIALAEGRAPEAARDLTPRGSVIIEWAPPHASRLPGCLTSVYDTATGEQFFTVLRVRLIDAVADDFVTADLTMLADDSGEPSAMVYERDGEVITGVFRFYVSEMRVRA